MANIKKECERWLANATADTDVAAELKTLDDLILFFLLLLLSADILLPYLFPPLCIISGTYFFLLHY